MKKKKNVPRKSQNMSTCEILLKSIYALHIRQPGVIQENNFLDLRNLNVPFSYTTYMWKRKSH